MKNIPRTTIKKCLKLINNPRRILNDKNCIIISSQPWEKMMNFNFELNKMQEIALAKNGANIMLNAPTGSGKTEAILLNCMVGKKYFYFLPTITSCIFMYNRLKEISNINLEIKTSILSEKNVNYNVNKVINITLLCPDQFLIGYLDKNENTGKNLILDELDNYPLMCQSVLLKYVEDINNKNSHIIVASATLNEDLQSVLNEKCFDISYDVEKKLIKHKIGFINSNKDIEKICKNNTDKKIGIICNSITDMEYLGSHISNNNMLFHHSKLDEVTRLENEKKLFEGRFNIVLSNDLISYSIDINFDILIIQMSDKMSLNIQRLGRNNRLNQKVGYCNTYIVNPALNCSLPFLDEYSANENFESFQISKSYNDIQNMRKNLIVEELPTIETILEYWNDLRKNDFELNLRKVPITFKYTFEDSKKVYNKETKKMETIVFQNTRTFKENNGIPFDKALPYANKEDAEKDIKKVLRLTYYDKNKCRVSGDYIIIGKTKTEYLIEKFPEYKWGFCPRCNDLINEKYFHFGQWKCYDCSNNDYDDEEEETEEEILEKERKELEKKQERIAKQEEILKSFADENEQIDFSDLNLLGYNLIFSGIKANEINNSSQEVCENIYNDFQYAHSIYNREQRANYSIDNAEQNSTSIWNIRQKASDIIGNWYQESEDIENSDQKSIKRISNNGQKSALITNEKQKEMEEDK